MSMLAAEGDDARWSCRHPFNSRRPWRCGAVAARQSHRPRRSGLHGRRADAGVFAPASSGRTGCNGSYAVALQAFYQHTGSATFDTTLPGERFDFRGNDSHSCLGLSFTVGDTPPAGRGLVGLQFVRMQNPPRWKRPTSKPIRFTNGSRWGCFASKRGNCGAFIWRAEDGGFVSTTSGYRSSRVAICEGHDPEACDGVFYNSEDNDANTTSNSWWTSKRMERLRGETIGQDGDKKPITTGPMKDYGQVMTPNPPPGGSTIGCRDRGGAQEREGSVEGA